MVDSKRSSRGAKGFLNPQTIAALASVPPAGYKTPPTLIGFKTIDPSVIALRIANYKKAYKTLSVNSWNIYVALGIQDFLSPDEYFRNKAHESNDSENLRLARYYRNILENHAKVDELLLKTISTVETALAESHPGFFDMSLKDMDSYRLKLKQPADDALMDIDSNSKPSSLAQAAKSNANDNAQSPVPPTTQEGFTQGLSSPLEEVLLTQHPADAAPFTPVRPSKASLKSTKKASAAGTDVTKVSLPVAAPVVSPPPLVQTTNTPLNVKRPTKVTTNVIRVEARWAPKDFNELRLSSKKLHTRLAPILSCFNNENTWLLEWQTDQMPESSDIEPGKLSQYLSIRVVPVSKDQCFYFSFRIHGTGSQLSQTLSSDVFSIAKRGENLHLDPSAIPPSQGELTYVGDILLKDASVTHRGQYLNYLRKEVLPADTPIFDIKFRRSNPTGSKVNILTVRCGKSTSTKLSEILCKALCGEGLHPEIFISRIALGANQTSQRDHEKIYKVHNEFLEDVAHLLFSASAAIDSPVTEFFDSGETVTRTPRQWAKSLVSPDGSSLEADLENGGAHESRTVLVVPSASLLLAKVELQNYWMRRNPSLTHATKLYKASVVSHPDIPKTVFTKNIDTILAKKIKKQTDAPTDDSSTAFSPVSSLTDGIPGGTLTSKGPSIAWRKPLQETLLSKATTSKVKAKVTMSSLEINQQKQIAILEAQLALRSGTNSVVSHASQSSKSSKSTKSAKSKASRSSTHSGLTASSAHSRVDKLEVQMKEGLAEIKALLKAMTIKDHPTTAPATSTSIVPLHTDPLWAKSAMETATAANGVHQIGHGMEGLQLFPNTQGCTDLAVLESPHKAKSKRSKPSSPTKPAVPASNLSLQYTEDTGSSGGAPC
jgi:hypothetical protein